MGSWLLLAQLLAHEPYDVALIELHDPSRTQSIYVNPREITSLRKPLAANKRAFTDGTHCVIVLTNSTIVGVAESCLDVIHILHGASQ